jgi:hypothetical protein
VTARAAPIRWDKGGEGSVVQAEKDRVRIRSTLASAPGSRLTGALTSGTPVRVKVTRCRRVEQSGNFVVMYLYLIEGRLLDATRDTMAELAALAEGNQESPGEPAA